MFVKKSKEELEGMDALELQAYYTEKFNHEKAELEARVASLEAEKGSDKYESLSEEVKALKESKIESLENALKMQGLVLDKIKSGKLDGNAISAVEGSIERAIEENIENFKSHASGDSNTKFKFEVKVAGDMTLTGNVSGGTMPQPQRLEGVNDIAERVAVTYGMIPKLTTDRNAIEWVYEANQDGTIDGTAEGAAKDQIDNDFVVTSVSLVKRAAYFKVSTEMLDDVTFMAGWLRNKLIIRLFLDVDNQCLNGDNTGQNLNGIINQATAFAAGTFANTVDNANDVDSLVVAINQIEIANQSVGNLQIQMHPSDVAALKLIKLSATDKRYIDRLVMVAGELSLDGVPIVKNNNITVGDFLVGDFSKATIVQKSGISVEVGLDGNDFTNNMRTILAEWRGQLFVQNNDTSAFVTGTFATTNAALETP